MSHDKIRQPANAGQRIGQIASDESGVSLIELAIILPLFLTLLIGAFEFAHTAYVRAILNGAVAKAARDNTLETATLNQTSLDNRVKALVGDVIGGATYTFQRKNYQSAADVKRPEDFEDNNNNGVRDTGECYNDYNNNGNWDPDRGRTGQGGASDYSTYTVTVEYPRILPLHRFIGGNPKHRLQSEAILANQPFGTQPGLTGGQKCN